MFFRFLLIISCLFLYSPEVYAEVSRVGVLHFRGVGLDEVVLLKLSDQTRAAALETLPKDQYLIMTRENMMQILSDMGKDLSCLDGSCEVDIGRNIGADLVVTGDILKMGSIYILTLKLFDTDSGALLSTIEVEDSELYVLKNKTLTQSKILFQKGLEMDTKEQVMESSFSNKMPEDDWELDSDGAENVIVKFDSTPKGAVVLMDGDLLCSATPCSREIPKAQHKFSFQKERYFSADKFVKVENGYRVTASLDPDFGYLSVASEYKGVQISMDGKPIGKLPIVKKEVENGEHKLTISDPCYIGEEYSFQITPRKHEGVLDYPLRPRMSAIDVSIKDLEGNTLLGQVYIGDQLLGETPLQKKVPLCTEKIFVRVNGKRHKKYVQLKEGEVAEVIYEIEPKSPARSGARKPPNPKAKNARNYEGPRAKVPYYDEVLVKASTFPMGCAKKRGCDEDEHLHQVRLTRDFYIMKSEVTQQLYYQVMGKNPSELKKPNHPVEQISWYDSALLANALSEKENLEPCYQIAGELVVWENKDCKGWRLPTEAEWEYAAYGGEDHYKFPGSNDPSQVAWYGEDWKNGHHKVCQKKRNGYGLCDMSGNVWEWCWDWKGTYDISATDPIGPEKGEYKIIRGGAYDSIRPRIRTTNRDGRKPAGKVNETGVRLVRNK